MEAILDHEHVLLGQRFATKDEVLEAIGEVFVRGGDATPAYVDAMKRKEAEFNTCVSEGIALPHGTSEVRDQVLRTSVVVVQLRDPVDWGQGRMVHLAIGLAGTGDEQHLRLLSRLARVLLDPQAVDRLRHTEDKAEVLAILAERVMQ